MKKLILGLILGLCLLSANCFAGDLIKDEDKFIYKTSLGIEADEVIIGDSKSADFKPQITFTKWKDKKGIPENSLTIKVPDGLIASSIPSLSARKVEIKDSKAGFYFNPDPDNADNFKFGLILYEKPTTNTWTFQLEGWAEFDFFYQPPLANVNPDGSTWEGGTQDNPENYRPADVNGSYAIYHKTKANHIMGQINYQTGKLFHIYRPKFIDANGAWVWADLNIQNGIYSVTVAQSFLDAAVYPVKVNDTFGNTAQGASLGNMERHILGTRNGLSPTSNGNGVSITAWLSVTTLAHNCKCALYLNDKTGPITNGTTEQKSVAVGAPQEISFNFTSAPSLSSASSYAIVAWGNAVTGVISLYYDDQVSGTHGGDHFISLDPGTWPNPWAPTDNSFKYSIYATYTPSGGTRRIMTFD